MSKPIAIRAPKDFWIGAIYLIAGTIGLLVGRDYPLGTAARMGPGFFPAIISTLLILFGVAAIVRSFVTNGDAVGKVPWRALALIIGAACGFGTALNAVGFIAAAALLLLLCAAASEHFRFEWRAVAGLVAMIAACSLVFVKALGLPMALVGPHLRYAVPFGLGN